MKFLTLKLLILSCLLLKASFAYSDNNLKLENLIIHKNPIKYNDIIFNDINDEFIDLSKFQNKLIILNFWATWCLPCKEEMPHLDKLQVNKKLSGIKIFPIHITKGKKNNLKKFFLELKIKNLSIYLDKKNNMPQKFQLRGLPTTIFINKKGEEFARIVGIYNFEEENFIKWLQKYN